MKRNFGNGEDAVSPVIGVMCYTGGCDQVILAVTVGSSLFGMGSDIERQNIVSAIASQPSPDRIVVTYYGGPDHYSVESITVTVNGLQVDDDDTDTPSAIEGVDPGYSLEISKPGDTDANNGIANLNDGNLAITSGSDHVTVSATFADGSDWVILDTYV